MLSRRARIAALALTLLAIGAGGVGARCLSVGQARCSLDTLLHGAPDLDVPYAVTRPEAVAAMLDLAEVGPGDHVIDLGTGDGRIAIAAAERGATALGIDIDPVLVAEARGKAREAGVAARTHFLAQDLFETPLGDADVVTMFLLPEVNQRLRPRLLAELRPGAHVVSHAFAMGAWQPDGEARVGGSRLYHWVVPAQVAGRWTLRDAAGERALVLRQAFQQLEGSLDGEPIAGGRLDGARIVFSVGERRYSGTVSGGAISGAGWAAAREREPVAGL
ncbi:class I SAM-dependent methyltransferase [Sphingosinithalassobacter sp. CS137]|uniref:class I SAM-dependent methyltransferase n=1 Tax=Sphingosinithalassobacter sp. CS137 TaxID=2762748 RepID=UPI00165D6412|nr:class I SAM-dependent methyltransferase [Sphingosinithalassobacter sp. CS137]